MYIAPTVVGDWVYVGSCAGTMYAFDAVTGVIRWSHDAETEGATQFHGHPVVVDSILIFGTDEGHESRGSLYAVNRLTGKVLWRCDWQTGLTSDIVRLDSLLYLTTQSDVMHAIQMRDGSTKWSFATAYTNTDTAAVAGERFIKRVKTDPLIYQDAVIFPGRDNVVYALDAATGDRVWSDTIDADMSTQLFLDEDVIVVGTHDGQLIGLDADDGKTAFEHTLPFVPVESMARTGDQLIMLAQLEPQRPTELITVHHRTGDLHWTVTNPDIDQDAYWFAPRIHLWRGDIVVGTSKGFVAAYSPDDGALRSTYKLDGAIRGIGSSEDQLYVGTFQGLLLALQRER
ncbi:MAG: PQQ-binding-like beta-propeller repeat protein [candidate division Zixibacteria bacterium]|nr:PQQ-binding-like beta-propeller repeat protein [candidate division Zixibacteria bacterium]